MFIRDQRFFIYLYATCIVKMDWILFNWVIRALLCGHPIVISLSIHLSVHLRSLFWSISPLPSLQSGYSSSTMCAFDPMVCIDLEWYLKVKCQGHINHTKIPLLIEHIYTLHLALLANTLPVLGAFWLKVCSDLEPNQWEGHSRSLHNKTVDYFPFAYR